MTDHVLTIQRVLSDGAIAKSITCRSGRIAVLRGNAPEKLYEYELALRGQHEDPSAFRISFDGAQYKPSDHLFLGFEPLRFKSDATVTNVLIDCGLNPEEVKTILLSHGFSQLAGTPVSQLSPNEAHCLALLRASHQPYP
ncbi:MAG: hypothetical protein KDD70_13770, partial [Bdellovibrionales bacterium]|nr:hypothetical protein [Bdellovibrionales bacterium]